MQEEDRKKMLGNRKSIPSFVQRLPYAKKKFRTYFPILYPAIRSLNLRNSSIIISSSHAFAHSVRTNKKQMHICYCHTPMRYIYDMQALYFSENGFQKGFFSFIPSSFAKILRHFDKKSAQKVTHFIANSEHTANNIRKQYGREATVIYPPVDTNYFSCNEQKEAFYFSSSRFVSYKKNDLLVDAFNQMPDKTLFLAGEGKFLDGLKKKAGPNITFLHYLSAEEYKDYLQKAKAFVFAAEEDFGITMVEAQACGTPVIAFKNGGAGEIVQHLKTGILFHEQSATSVKDAVTAFESMAHTILPVACSQNAERFSMARFHAEMKSFIETHIHEIQS
jgi:glycosyltransferase involved in cell wall biosynthesis